MGKPLDIDLILEKCGDFNRYQFYLLSCFCLINILASTHYYSQTIISFVPDHWCRSEALKNASIEEVRKFYSVFANPSCTNIDAFVGIQNEDKAYSSFDNLDKSASRLLRATDLVNAEHHRMDCTEWIYDYEFLFGYRSMTSELNWVCQNAWKSILGQSTYFIGSVVGTLTLGILADEVGRLPVLIIAHLAGIIGNGLTIFATDEITFAVCRFISGIATDNNFVMMYILVLEYIAPRMRTVGLNLCIGIFYCLGSVFTPWLAVWLGNWRLYLFATIVPALTVPLFYFIVPESAQWLISRNKIDEALVCFKKIARYNRKELDENFEENFKCVVSEINRKRAGEDEHPTLFALFKTPRLRRLTLILFFKSMIITLGYDAISKNVEGLGMSPFVLFSLSAFAIFPACLVLLVLQDRIGRKAMASSSLIISGLFTASTGVILAYQKNTVDSTLIAVLCVVARFGVTVAYNSGAQYAAELIPTCVRGQGISAAHVAGYALTFFSSYILYTAIFFKALPSLILGVLSFAGALCCLFLPETLNRKTPVTLQEGEEFGRGEKFFHFACFDKTSKEKPNSTS